MERLCFLTGTVFFAKASLLSLVLVGNQMVPAHKDRLHGLIQPKRPNDRSFEGTTINGMAEAPLRRSVRLQDGGPG